MDRKQIAQQASQLKNKGDLLNLLNLIKKAEIEEMGFDSSQYHPFTENSLTSIVTLITLFIVTANSRLKRSLVAPDKLRHQGRRVS